MTPELTQQQIEATTEAVSAAFSKHLDVLKSLVRIPGIAWDAFDAAELERSADAVADLLRGLGVFDLVEIRRSSAAGAVGAPAVIARRAAKNGRGQVLLYAHHDVQPPGDSEVWRTAPFEPTQVGDRLYGRGAADDKAGIVAHLGAIEALKLVAGDDFDLGISLFIEGEEEAGSPTFANFLVENAEILEADVIIVADSGNWSLTTPALTSSLRGLVSQVIEVATLDHAVHSGMFGGAVPDSMTAMIRLLASLHDANGDVAVVGLKHHTAAAPPYEDADLRRDSGLLDGVSQLGSGSIVERIWAKPSITVIGLDNPSVALSSNTLQPKTQAKISLRIAPGQDPAEALELLREHLRQNVPFGAKLSFGDIELGQPFAVDSTGWAAKLMRDSLATAYGESAVDMGIGGSIPFIADLKRVFPAAQILVTGVEDPDSRAHSPNESLHIDTLRRAMTAEALFLAASNQISK